MASKREKNGAAEDYNEAYRHFDTLIWGSFVAATGVFTAIFLGLSDVKLDAVSQATGISKDDLIKSFLALMSLPLLVLSYALYRFRKHQWAVRTSGRTKTQPWKSASTYFHILVNLQALAVIVLIAVAFGFSFGMAIVAGAILVAVATAVMEKSVRSNA